MKNKRKPSISPKTAKKRLRLMLVVFFICMSIPVYLLLNKVYSQLKNEAYFDQHNQASNLVDRIEQNFLKVLEQEQNRPIAEYSFFNILESPLLKSSAVKFSPLSSMPPQTNVPGLTGYFQIDQDGGFQIPALPEIKNKQANLSQQELSNRIALKDKLRQLLAVDTQEKNTDTMTEKDAFVEEKIPDQNQGSRKTKQAYRLDQDYQFADKAQTDSIGRLQAMRKNKNNNTKLAYAKKSQTLSQESLQQLNIDDKRFKQQPEENASLLSRQQQAKSESKFRRRKEIVKLPEQSRASEYFNRSYDQQIASAPTVESVESVEKEEVKADAITALKESKPSTISLDDEQSPIKILSFESEVGPLQMIELDQQFFCFFRSVWHDNKRYIQGFVVNQSEFIKATVKPFVNSQQTAPFSSLLLAYNGKLIQQFKIAQLKQETLVYRASFSPPLQALEIIVNSASISAGPGSNVVNILALSLAIILITGLIGFYRLGSGQIDLASKQRNFVSAVSHELKTPLTSIRMYGEILRSEWVVDEKKKKNYYDYIFFESERLTRLINNVLQLARLDNHVEKIELQPIYPVMLLQRVSEKVKTQIEASGFTLNLIGIDSTSDKLEINVDEDAFLQIMINLVDNAIKFSSKASNKVIDLGVRKTSRNKEVVFFVRDYGPGIEKKQMKKIFQLFYRSGDELTRTQPGTGIGLTLVSQLADRMNAKIDLVNRSPGAEFQIIFSNSTNINLSILNTNDNTL